MNSLGVKQTKDAEKNYAQPLLCWGSIFRSLIIAMIVGLLLNLLSMVLGLSTLITIVLAFSATGVIL